MASPHAEPPAHPVSVVIIDDHMAIVEMMSPVIESIPRFKVVGFALEAAEGLSLCRRLQPQIIVLDLILPPTSGLTLLADLRSVCPQSKVLVFSGNLSSSAIRGAFAAGASGFVEKAGSLDEFRAAMQAMVAGQTYFGAHTSSVIKTLVCRNAPVQSELTPRERVILRHIAEGLSSKEIAGKLGISVHTVLNHRSRVMQKTGLHRVAQLSLHAAQLGLIGDLAQGRSED